MNATILLLVGGQEVACDGIKVKRGMETQAKIFVDENCKIIHICIVHRWDSQYVVAPMYRDYGLDWIKPMGIAREYLIRSLMDRYSSLNPTFFLLVYIQK